MTTRRSDFRLGAGALLLATISCSSAPTNGSGNAAPSSAGAGGTGLVPPFPSAPSAGGAAVTGNGGTAGSVVAIGSGGADSAGGTTATGGAAPNPYDPSITFDWPEGTTAAKKCQAGHYVGTYTCTVTYGDGGGFSYPLTGPVDLVLAESSDGEFLTVSGGTLKSAAGFIAADAKVVGQLSCGSGAFTGTLQDGTLSIPPFPPGGTFGGDLSAGFVSVGPKLDGRWALVGEGQFAGYGCTGTWTAALQP